MDVFADAAGSWSRQAGLHAGEAASNDLFGSAVALSGSRLLVGAPFLSTLGPRRSPVAPVGGTAAGTSGSVYVFDHAASTWSPRGKLVASDAAAHDLCGDAVAFSGTTAMIGAPDKAAGKADYAGRVYVESFAAPVVTLSASSRTASRAFSRCASRGSPAAAAHC